MSALKDFRSKKKEQALYDAPNSSSYLATENVCMHDSKEFTLSCYSKTQYSHQKCYHHIFPHYITNNAEVQMDTILNSTTRIIRHVLVTTVSITWSLFLVLCSTPWCNTIHLLLSPWPLNILKLRTQHLIVFLESGCTIPERYPSAQPAVSLPLPHSSWNRS